MDEVTNYLITVPIHQYRLEEIGDALIGNVISKYCVPDYIIMDQDSTFMSSLISYLFKKLNIKIKLVAPTIINCYRQNMELKSLFNDLN